MRCPICKAKNLPNKDSKTGQKTVRKFGSYRRKSDSRRIQRYVCLRCEKTFSSATDDPAYGQKKRRLNIKVQQNACSLMSIRRSATCLKTTQQTVARKIEFLASQAHQHHKKALLKGEYNPTAIQFDELQTIEHTKCKPLMVAMAVDKELRYILGFRISSMPATGHLAKLAKAKYGIRPNQRIDGLNALMNDIKPSVNGKTTFESDMHPIYEGVVKLYYPQAKYTQYKGEKSCVAGQGELKKKIKDPLFSINHTFAMCRANINRLIRKTWCTTKDPARLGHHLAIYMDYHNKQIKSELIKKQLKIVRFS